MKNILEKLEKAKFIGNIHKQALLADTMHYIDRIKDNIDRFQSPLLSIKSKKYKHFLDLRVKSNVMVSGFYDYLVSFATSKVSDDSVISCNIDDGYLLVAFKDRSAFKIVMNDIFEEQNILPLHMTEIDLDYNLKIHILLYDQRNKFNRLLKK